MIPLAVKIASIMKPDLSKKITLGFALAVFIILVAALLSYQRMREQAAARQWVLQSNEVLAELGGAVSDVTEAETGVRGFLLTGDDAYLESWHAGVQDAPEHLRRLYELTADNPGQQARVADLDRASQEKLAWVAQTVDTYRNQGPPAAKAAVMSGKGRAQMDRVRQIASEMAKQEKQLLQERTERTELKTRHVTTYLRVLAAMVVIILGLAFYQIRTEMRELGRVQSELAESQNKLEEALSREQELSRSDPLTQVANRRAFSEALEIESRRASRYGRPVSIAYIDLDNFKNFNDSLGHVAGDALLVTVGQTMQRHVRAGSCVARVGGDEFALMIPDVGAMEVELTLRRIRRLLLDEMKSNGWPVTFSIGAVVFSQSAGSGEEMIHRADQEMYAVKNRSKDDVSVVTVETPATSVVRGKRDGPS